LGYGPQYGVRIRLFTLKLDLWTAFGYTGFSVYGLFGRGAFGYTGFSVVTPLKISHNYRVSILVLLLGLVFNTSSVVYFFCTILTPSKILAVVSPFSSGLRGHRIENFQNQQTMHFLKW
jgi:hypothetical protein